MDNGLRYNSITNYYKTNFGTKVYKLALDIGATCPNRDGSKGYGGCIYCSECGSGDYATVYNQIQIAKNKIKHKEIRHYIAYLQSFTNTYMPCEKLDEYISQILSDEQVVGISIATRPDCISDEMLQYLVGLNKKTHLVIELGLQSVKNSTLKIINRGHTFEDFLHCFERLKQNGIKVCVHLMNGLPSENQQDMLDSVQCVAKLLPHSVKLHCVYIPKNTKLENMFKNGEYKPLEMQEYVEILAKQIAILPPEIYVERITGDGDRENLVAPKWTLHKRYFLNQFNSYLAKNNIKQGVYAHKNIWLYEYVLITKFSSDFFKVLYVCMKECSYNYMKIWLYFAY